MIFRPAEILLPQDVEMEKWAVIACDQFTSQPSYWEEVRTLVGDAPSTLSMIYPEAELSSFESDRISKINAAMKALRSKLKEYPQALIYVERTMADGKLRKGIIGAIDLECYEYSWESDAKIRATERTVMERIPPRVEIRKDADLELQHVLLLCDDERGTLIEPLKDEKDDFTLLYDFSLMQGGGQIKGWLLSDSKKEAFMKRMDQYLKDVKEKYDSLEISPIYFAVGDGNHSLAAAKANYEALKESGKTKEELLFARYALVELGNIHEQSLEFEAIHRLVKVEDVIALMEELKEEIGAFPDPLLTPEENERYTIRCFTKEGEKKLCLDPKKGALAVGILQEFLDKYLETHGGEIDYIHGEETLKELITTKNQVGFLLPAFAKEALFLEVAKKGSLPRKTFSMGHAEEKRYYLEARQIRPTEKR